MAGDPRIQQQVAWAGIKSRRVLGGRQIGKIGDTANIDDDAMDIWMAQYPVVEGRNQRRTLTTCCDVTAAKIAHHMDAGQFCQ